MQVPKESLPGVTTTEFMPNAHLHAPFVCGLKDIYDAEKQLVNAIPKLIKAATNEDLIDALSMHLRETKNHVVRIEKVFKSIDESIQSKACPAMKGLVEECAEATKEKEVLSRDASIIAAAQKVEHYEIGTYGTLRSWAEAMGHDEAAGLLEDTLGEEKAADEKLSAVAKELCNCPVEG